MPVPIQLFLSLGVKKQWMEMPLPPKNKSVRKSAGEEFYAVLEDPYEWNNLANDSQ